LKPAPHSFDLLASLYFKRGMYDEAYRAIERALALAPDDPLIIQRREQIRNKMKK
jgi:tetratricopeptide (TPR) repeat protein